MSVDVLTPRINNSRVMRTLLCMFLIAAMAVLLAGQDTPKVAYVYCSSRDTPVLTAMVYSSPPLFIPLGHLNCGDKVQVLGRTESWIRITSDGGERYVPMTTLSQRKARFVALDIPLPPEPKLVEPDQKPLISLMNALDSASLSGSLEISGDCGSERFPQFPQVGQGKSDSTLTRLAEMLSSSGGVTVSQDSNGIVRIIGPDVPTDFLNVKISHITFEDDKHNALFYPTYAMWTVLAAPEVVAFFNSHDIEMQLRMMLISGNPFVTPPPDAPHISGSLENVTVGEVLDRILHSFPGVWFYGNCTQNEKHKRAIFVQFYRSRKRRNLVSGGM